MLWLFLSTFCGLPKRSQRTAFFFLLLRSQYNSDSEARGVLPVRLRHKEVFCVSLSLDVDTSDSSPEPAWPRRGTRLPPPAVAEFRRRTDYSRPSGSGEPAGPTPAAGSRSVNRLPRPGVLEVRYEDRSWPGPSPFVDAPVVRWRFESEVAAGDA